MPEVSVLNPLYGNHQGRASLPGEQLQLKPRTATWTRRSP